MPSVPTAVRSPRARTAALIALLTTSFAPAARVEAQEPGLTLDEAIALAHENNPSYLQQRNDLTVANSAVRAAYGGLLPSANASTSFGYTAPGEVRLQTLSFGREPESYYSSYNLGLNYQLDGRTVLAPSVQRAQRTATERRIEGVGASLSSQVTQQYLGVLRARDEVEQARREVARTEEYLRLADARLEVGLGTPLELRSAQVQKGRAEVAVVRAENAEATAILTLSQILGTEVDTTTALTSTFEIFEPEWSVESLIELAEANNPLLLATRAGASAARTSLTAARTAYLPSLNLNLGWRGYVSEYGTIDPLVERALGNMDLAACEQNNRLRALIGEPPQPCADPQDPAVREMVAAEIAESNQGFPFDYINQPFQASLTVSLPIFTGFSRQQQIDQAAAQAADARYEVRAEELRVRQEVASAARNVDAAYRTALLQEQVRENAAEELRLAQERFRFGAASSVEVTDAQTNLAQAERDQIAAIYDFHQSLAALEALVGRPLR